MPELPEVETVKNILKEMTLGKTIKSVDVLRQQTIEGDSKEFSKSLLNETITDFGRVGKFIIFYLTNNKVMISHLRMEGKYFLKNESEKITKHDMVVFHFNDGTKLLYNDTRRFGKMLLSTEQQYMNVPPLNNVGPDPFMLENAKILQKAMRSTFSTILENADENPAIYLKELKDAEVFDGYDVSKMQRVNLIETGIIDATKVVRSSLQAATSIAGLVLTTNVVITQDPEEKSGINITGMMSPNVM